MRHLSPAELRSLAAHCGGAALLLFAALFISQGGLERTAGALALSSNSQAAATALGDTQGVPPGYTEQTYTDYTSCWISYVYSGYGLGGGNGPLCRNNAANPFYSGIFSVNAATPLVGASAYVSSTFVDAGLVQGPYLGPQFDELGCPSGYTLIDGGSECYSSSGGNVVGPSIMPLVPATYCYGNSDNSDNNPILLVGGGAAATQSYSFPPGYSLANGDKLDSPVNSGVLGSPRDFSSCYAFKYVPAHVNSSPTTVGAVTVAAGAPLTLQWSCLPSRTAYAWGCRSSRSSLSHPFGVSCGESQYTLRLYNLSPLASSVSGSGSGFSPSGLANIQTVTAPSAPGTYNYSLTCSGGQYPLPAMTVPVTVTAAPVTETDPAPNPPGNTNGVCQNGNVYLAWTAPTSGPEPAAYYPRLGSADFTSQLSCPAGWTFATPNTCYKDNVADISIVAPGAGVAGRSYSAWVHSGNGTAWTNQTGADNCPVSNGPGINCTPGRTEFSCTPTPPTSCTPDNWSCGNWGTCSGGTQSRVCTNSGTCNTTASPATSQSCTGTPSSAPSCTITPSPTTVWSGGGATLNYTTNNASSASITCSNNGVAGVSCQSPGSVPAVAASSAPSGTITNSTASTRSVSYTMTLNGGNTCQANVNVKPVCPAHSTGTWPGCVADSGYTYYSTTNTTTAIACPAPNCPGPGAGNCTANTGYTYNSGPNTCTANAVSTCANGLNFSLYGPGCSCPQNQVQVGSGCVAVSCPNGLNINLYPLCACPSGQVQSGSTCINNIVQSGLSLTAMPSRVHRGGQTTLTWSSNIGDTSCALTSSATGTTLSTLLSGTLVQTVTRRTTFTLTCNSGNLRQSVSILPSFIEI